MADVCGPNEKEQCAKPGQADSPWLKEAQPPVPDHSAGAKQVEAKSNETKLSDTKPADPMPGSHEAERLIDQAQKLIQDDPLKLTSSQYQELLKKAMDLADRQFNSDKDSLQQNIQTDGQQLQQLSNGKVGDLQKALTAWQNQSNDAQQPWSQINTEVTTLQKHLIAGGLTSAQQNDILKRIEQLSQQQIQLLPPKLREQYDSIVPDWKKANELTTEIQVLNGQLGGERHASVMARAFLQESLRYHGDTAKADQLLHEAIFDIGGTPQEITLHAGLIVASLERQGVNSAVAFNKASRVYALAEDIADGTSKEALDVLSNTNQQTNDSYASQIEKQHLITVAMSSIESRWSHGQAEYNADPNNKQNVAEATRYIEQSQAKLKELDSLVNYVAPSYMGDMPVWENPLAGVAPDLNQPIALYKQLTSGAFNQIEQKDLEITHPDAIERSINLNHGQQMVCDGIAFTAGYGGAAGISFLATPETFGIGTVPAFLAGRAAAGSLSYNACRIAFGKPLTIGSVAWGATDGLVGGTDAYFLRGAGELGITGLLKGSAPGALLYSSANAASNYWDGMNTYDVALGFGTNLGSGLFAPAALMRPYRLALGVAAIRLLASGTKVPREEDKP